MTSPVLPLGTFVIELVLVVLIGFSFSMIGSGVSGLIVEVDVDRPRGFFKGPRWVSLNSTGKSAKSWKGLSRSNALLVKFQDILLEYEVCKGKGCAKECGDTTIRKQITACECFVPLRTSPSCDAR